MLMVGLLAAVLALSVAAICIAGYLLAAHRARAAADLAALSGAAAFAAGQDGCSAANGNATANDARVVSCSQVGDPVDFVVTVKVEVVVQVTAPGLPRRLGAVAHAGSGAG